MLIEILSELGDWTKCNNAAKEMLRSFPQMESAYCAQAWSFKKLKKYEDAILVCNDALLLFPNSVNLHSIRGHCNYDAGYYKQATADFHRTIELDRKNNNLPVGPENGLKPWKRNAWRLR